MNYFLFVEYMPVFVIVVDEGGSVSWFFVADKDTQWFCCLWTMGRSHLPLLAVSSRDPAPCD